MLHRLFFICITLFISVSYHAQDVLDAPFPVEKNLLYPSYPLAVTQGCLSYVPLEEREDRSAIESSSFYMNSYLYGEPEYHRVRVLRYMPLSSNPAFADVPKQRWAKAEDGEWTVKNAKGKPIDPLNDKGWRFNTRPFSFVNELIGKNIDSILNKTAPNNEARFIYEVAEPDINAGIANGVLAINERGVLTKVGMTIPHEFELRPLVDFLLQALFYDGVITSYLDMGFTHRQTMNELRQTIGASPEKAVKVQGIRIKEDYFVDQHTGRLTSKIIGIAFVGEDTAVGKELIWMYYPEVRWALRSLCTITSNDEIVNVEYLLDKHQYDGSLDTMYHIGSGTYDHDDLWLVDLDAQLVLELWKEYHAYHNLVPNGRVKQASVKGLPPVYAQYEQGVPNGSLTVLYPNGKPWIKGNVDNGVCAGDFSYFYPTLKRMAERHFERGQLIGRQTNYWENQNIYAQYEMLGGNATSLKRWYEDGQLMEAGDFKQGLLHGVWEYHIRPTSETRALFMEYCNRPDHAYMPDYKSKDTFILEVLYEHTPAQDAPPIYGGVWATPTVIKK